MITVQKALYPFRYALNENTDGYTTPYWDFARFQHEIDILALSGFNAILIQRGNDLAVYQAFLDLGYTDAGIRQWITQPAHQNWQWMGNMCCFTEPISLALMQRRAASARRIIDQLRALGITPVLPGFWGVVPADFAQHVPGAHVVIQTEPWNGFQRPGWLDPSRSSLLRPPRRRLLHKHQRDLFGDTTLYDMETFQEGGQSGDVPVPEGARAIQKALNTAHPNALWFMMAWQTNPRADLIASVDRSHILIADIEQGRVPRETRETDFQGARWLFGGLWEFGGRTTMGAPLYDYALRMPAAAARPGSHLSGTALFTEGLETNPFAFDLYTEDGLAQRARSTSTAGPPSTPYAAMALPIRMPPGHGTLFSKLPSAIAPTALNPTASATPHTNPSSTPSPHSPPSATVPVVSGSSRAATTPMTSSRPSPSYYR